jgi:hypothetical protein
MQLNATAIALIVTPRFIVLAADSKVVNLRGEFVRNECKTIQAGKNFYAPINFVRYSPTGFDLEKIILNVTADSISEMVDRVTTAVSDPLKAALISRRSQNPGTFEREFPNGQATGVAFVGIENGSPAMVFLGFTILEATRANPQIKAGRYSCPGDCRDGHFGLFVPAELQAMFEQKYPHYWSGDDAEVADNAQAFINLAIARKLQDVGPPVSVLVVDRVSTRWLKTGTCKP